MINRNFSIKKTVPNITSKKLTDGVKRTVPTRILDNYTNATKNVKQCKYTNSGLT